MCYGNFYVLCHIKWRVSFIYVCMHVYATPCVCTWLLCVCISWSWSMLIYGTVCFTIYHFVYKNRHSWVESISMIFFSTQAHMQILLLMSYLCHNIKIMKSNMLIIIFKIQNFVWVHMIIVNKIWGVIRRQALIHLKCNSNKGINLNSLRCDCNCTRCVRMMLMLVLKVVW